MEKELIDKMISEYEDRILILNGCISQLKLMKFQEEFKENANKIN